MKVNIIDRKKDDKGRVNLFFQTHRGLRRTILNDKVLKYLNVDDILVGDEIEVLLEFRRNRFDIEKFNEFYMIRKVY